MTMQITPIKTRIFRENEDLFSFVLKHIKKLPEKSILAVTSKIVSLAEDRTVEYKNERQRIKLIKQESEFALRLKHVWLSIKDNMVMANSGIDQSNTNGKMVLLPKNSFRSAGFLRKKLMQKFHLENFGVLVTDSEFMPLRVGALGVALGYAGFSGIRNYIGKKDIFGRIFKFSRTNIADSLATSAVLCMGEGKEQQPLAVITNAPVIFTKKVKRNELVINPKKDIYAPLFKNLKSNAKRK